MKSGVGFNRQLVIGQVGRFQCDGVSDVGQRLLDRLPRQTKHQVQVEVVQPGSMGGFGGGESVATAMDPPQLAQLPVIETLNTDRQAVNTCFPELGELAPLHRAGISFQGNLGVWP